jgi:hypothetical protein
MKHYYIAKATGKMPTAKVTGMKAVYLNPAPTLLLGQVSPGLIV